MRDVLGNRLEKGSLVLWDVSEVPRRGLVAHVVDVVEPMLSGADGNAAGGHSVVLQVVIHVNPPPNLPSERLQIQQLMRIVDPASESAVDRVLSVLPGGRPPLPPRKPQ